MSKEIGNTPANKNYQPSGITRAEEIALEKYPHNAYGGTLGDSLRAACMVGYHQGKKDTIEKAAAWLKANWRDYVWTTDNGIPHFGLWENDFRKAMEEE